MIDWLFPVAFVLILSLPGWSLLGTLDRHDEEMRYWHAAHPPYHEMWVVLHPDGSLTYRAIDPESGVSTEGASHNEAARAFRDAWRAEWLG